MSGKGGAGVANKKEVIQKLMRKNKVLQTDRVVQKYMLIDGKKDDNTWKVIVGNNVPKLIFIKPLHRYWKKELLKMGD